MDKKVYGTRITEKAMTLQFSSRDFLAVSLMLFEFVISKGSS